MATSRYEGSKLIEVRLYPADCGIDGMRPVSKAGHPMTPSRSSKHIQNLSSRLGTTISKEDNVGLIRVAQTGTQRAVVPCHLVRRSVYDRALALWSGGGAERGRHRVAALP
jgi:hypothetical protein